MKGWIYINEAGEYAQECGPSGFSTKMRIVFGPLNQATVFHHHHTKYDALKGLNRIPAKVTRIVTIISEGELNE